MNNFKQDVNRDSVEPAPFIQRMIQFLEQPSLNGRLIPGTRISQERLEQLINFLRLRSQGKQPWAAHVRRLLARLEQTAPGEDTIAGVGVEQFKRLISSIPASSRLFTSNAQNAPDKAADSWMTAWSGLDHRLERMGEAVRSVGESLQHLTQQFQQIEQELGLLIDFRNSLRAERALPETISTTQPASPALPKKAEPTLNHWFSDFLD
jgi:pSer/pThr/pTyr-binding forkhead associated (FHA) protein